LVDELVKIAPAGAKETRSSESDRARQLIQKLLASTDGIDPLIEVVKTKALARSLVVLVVEGAKQHLQKTGAAGRMPAILKAVVAAENSDSKALWSALSAYCKEDVPDAGMLLKDSLARLKEPLREAGKRYDKYAWQCLKPDGGLGRMLILLKSASEAETAWLAPMCSIAARNLIGIQSPADTTLKALLDYLQITVRKHLPEDVDRSLIIAASKHVERLPELKAILAAIQPKLASWGEAWVPVQRKIDEALGATQVAPTPVEEAEIVPAEIPPAPPANTTAILQGVHQSLIVLAAQVQQALERHGEQQGDVNTLITCKSRLERELGTLKEEHDDSLAQIQDLRAKTKAQQDEMKGMNGELDEARRQRDEAREDARKTKDWAEQDVSLAKGEAEAAVANFRSRLWQELRPHFVEVMDAAHQGQADFTQGERILYARLTDTFEVLKRHGMGSAQPNRDPLETS